MRTFSLRFTIGLREYGLASPVEHSGPYFHRWLPDGENDAIALGLPRTGAQLKLWFERRGFVHRGFIEYDTYRHEVDPDIMTRQGVLEGGPLMGLLSGCELSQEELSALNEDRRGDPSYEALGKRVINLVFPEVSRFISIVRTNYGQYWVKELEGWDSRKRTLGSYCRFILNSEWSLDDGETWQPFVPNEPMQNGVHLDVSLSDKQRFTEYITREDWQWLAEYYRRRCLPSPSANILLSTHKHLDQGDLRYAFIEGVTALEMALSEFIQDGIGGRDALNKPLTGFFELRLPSQLASIAVTLGLDAEAIEKAVEAVSIRNKIVHEGHDPPSSSEDKLRGLMHVTSQLISGLSIRFPTINPGNAVMPREDWESAH